MPGAANCHACSGYSTSNPNQGGIPGQPGNYICTVSVNGNLMHSFTINAGSCEADECIGVHEDLGDIVGGPERSGACKVKSTCDEIKEYYRRLIRDAIVDIDCGSGGGKGAEEKCCGEYEI